METIALKRVVEHLDSGDEFSIAFRTCDKERGSGGEWVAIPRAKKCMQHTADQIRQVKLDAGLPAVKCDPRHQVNSTRNIVVIPSGRIIKVHLRLIRRFNNKTLT